MDWTWRIDIWNVRFENTSTGIDSHGFYSDMLLTHKIDFLDIWISKHKNFLTSILLGLTYFKFTNYGQN